MMWKFFIYLFDDGWDWVIFFLLFVMFRYVFLCGSDIFEGVIYVRFFDVLV